MSQQIGRGPGRVLIAVYALFALAATGRSVMQIAQTWPHPPMPFLLSALAAVIYLLATFALARGRRALALVTIAFEMAGVLAVGLWSYLDAAAFVVSGDHGDTTVWARFGQGYGYVPLVLPALGLWWLARQRRQVSS